MPAASQLFAGLPPATRQQLHTLGPTWGADIRANSAWVKQAYRSLLMAAPTDGIRVDRDIAYGSHSRQRLDVFRRELRPGDGASPRSPVIVFVHGGAFVRGEKSGEDGLYDNVLYWFARHGFVGVNVEYRHAPETIWPGGADDIAAASEWVARHIGAFDGDPARQCLIGHSAGGTHVASHVFDRSLAQHAPCLRAAVLISARLRADVSPENPNAEGVRAYFGADETSYEAKSPVSHAAGSGLATMIVIAQYENPLLDLYGLEMAHAIAVSRGVAPRVLTMAGHNHMSIVAHFNTAEERLGLEIVDFLSANGLAIGQ